MKQINAYIKPHRLTKVTMALQKVKRLGGMTVFEVRGFGRKREDDPLRPVVDDLMDFAEYVKIEIFCPDDLVEELVSVIDKTRGMVRMKAGVDGRVADGVVLVPHGWAGDANANLLTDVQCREPIMGYPDMKSLQCSIRKA